MTLADCINEAAGQCLIAIAAIILFGGLAALIWCWRDDDK